MSRVQFECFHKPLAQGGKKSQGAAQKNHLARYAAAARQAADGLVDHGLHDGSRDVVARATLVEQGQDIGFCEHAATGSYGIQRIEILGQFVQPVGVCVKKGGHLIDEGPGASGAGLVHALVQAAGKKGQLGVFSAQFYGHVGVGNAAADAEAGGDHLLDKGQAHFLGQGDGAGAAQGHMPERARKSGQGFAQKMGHSGPYFGQVSLVAGKKNITLLIEDNDFTSG